MNNDIELETYGVIKDKHRHKELMDSVYTNPGGHSFLVFQNMVLFAVLHVCLIAAIEIGFYFIIIKKKENETTQKMINTVGLSSARSILSKGAYYLPSADEQWTISSFKPAEWKKEESTPLGNTFRALSGKVQYKNTVDDVWVSFSKQPPCSVSSVAVSKMKIYVKCVNGNTMEQAEGVNIWKIPQIRNVVLNKLTSDAKTASEGLKSAQQQLRADNKPAVDYAISLSKWSITKVLIVTLGVTILLICIFFPPASILGPLSSLWNCIPFLRNIKRMKNINYRDQESGSRRATCTPFKFLQKLACYVLRKDYYYNVSGVWKNRLSFKCGNAHLKWNMFQDGFYELLLTLALICGFEWVFFFHVASQIIPITGNIAKDKLVMQINNLFHSKLLDIPVLSSAEQARALGSAAQQSVESAGIAYVQNAMKKGTGSFAALVGHHLRVPLDVPGSTLPIRTSSFAQTRSTEIRSSK